MSTIQKAIENVTEIKDKVVLCQRRVKIVKSEDNGDGDGGGDCGGVVQSDANSIYDDRNGDAKSTGDITNTQVNVRHQFQLSDEQYKHGTHTGECYILYPVRLNRFQ